jgi:hypothetical protein
MPDGAGAASEKRPAEKGLSRNTIPTDLWVQSGSGDSFRDPAGYRYSNFCSQTLNLSLGHAHPAVNDALHECIDKLTFVSSRFGNRYVSELAERLLSNVPEPLAGLNLKVTSGSLANEGALKAAYKKRGTTEVVALHNITAPLLRLFHALCEPPRSKTAVEQLIQALRRADVHVSPWDALVTQCEAFQRSTRAVSLGDNANDKK